MLAWGWDQTDALGSAIGGISTFLAFGGTLWIIRQETKARRSAEAERDAERRDDERRQARLVYAALGDRPDSLNADSHVPPPSANEVHAQVFNHSDEPIWDVLVIVPGLEHLRLRFDHIGPRNSAIESFWEAPDDWYLNHVGAGCIGEPTSILFDVEFSDNAGRRWRRIKRAQPERLYDGRSEGSQ